MKQKFSQFIVTILISGIFLMSPSVDLAQRSAPSGVLTVSGLSSQGNLVTVNGQNALDGRSMFSPSKIVTSPQGNAVIRISGVGVISLRPDAAMNLSFDNYSISGDILSGKVVIETSGQTALNLLMADGTLTSSPTQPINVEIAVTNGKTQIRSVQGIVIFNGAIIPSGQILDDQSGGSPKNQGAKSGNSSFLLIGIIAAAAAAVLLGVVVAGGGNDGAPPVSPTR